MSDLIIHESSENLRVVEIDSYVTHIRREDPYGFWVFHWKDGEPPEVLRGSFTNINDAYTKLKNWYSQLPPRLQPSNPKRKN